MRLVAVAVLAGLLVSAAQAADPYLTCRDLASIREKAEAGEKPSQGFLNGWLSGVSGMTQAHTVMQYHQKKQQDVCVDVEAHLDRGYLDYEEVLRLYDKGLEMPHIAELLTSRPLDCRPEMVLLVALQEKYPCN